MSKRPFGEDVLEIRRRASEYRSRGETEKALQEIERALRIAPGNVSLLVDLAEMTVEARHYGKAKHVYRVLLEENLDGAPITKAEVFRRIGDVHVACEDPLRAAVMYEKAIGADPNMSRAKEQLAEVQAILRKQPLGNREGVLGCLSSSFLDFSHCDARSTGPDAERLSETLACGGPSCAIEREFHSRHSEYVYRVAEPGLGPNGKPGHIVAQVVVRCPRRLWLFGEHECLVVRRDQLAWEASPGDPRGQ